MECVDPLLMTGNPVFVRFHENMVDARQNVRPAKQRLQQVDLDSEYKTGLSANWACL